MRGWHGFENLRTESTASKYEYIILIYSSSSEGVGVFISYILRMYIYVHNIVEECSKWKKLHRKT